MGGNMRDVAVLIPTKGRVETLSDMFDRCPELNTPDTYISIENEEKELYQKGRANLFNKCTLVYFDNPGGFASNAREIIRKAAVVKRYKGYLSTDDNAKFNSKSLRALLLAFETEQCVMSGMGQPALWHQDAINKGKVYNINGFQFTTFEAFSSVHWIIPHHLYREFTYPENSSNDDVYFALWAILRKNYTNFRMCLEAKYSKKRFMPGGHGNNNERLKKMALSMYQLACDFPEVADNRWMLTKFPFSKIIKFKKEEDK
jgi:hypothetical protein